MIRKLEKQGGSRFILMYNNAFSTNWEINTNVSTLIGAGLPFISLKLLPIALLLGLISWIPLKLVTPFKGSAEKWGSTCYGFSIVRGSHIRKTQLWLYIGNKTLKI